MVDLIKQNRFMFVVTLFLTSIALVSSQTICINEFMASNGTYASDYEGSFSDWIEIYNYGQESVDITGLFLSDSDSDLIKWQFPSATIPSEGFLIIWASGNDMVAANGEIHTNFKISADGEPLYLTAADGVTVLDYVAPVIVQRDFSYGRTTDAASEWAYFPQPTAGETNNTSTGYTEILSSPQFNIEGGFFTENIQVQITHPDPQAMIYYTLDGSEPDPDNIGGTTYSYKNYYPVNPGDAFGEFLYRQITTYQYSAPITIESRINEPYQIAGITTYFSHEPRLPYGNIYKGTIVRAKAFKPGALPGSATTNTYFISDDAINRYNLPTISISVDEDSFFDYYIGINVPGYLADQWRLNNPSQIWTWQTPSNSLQRGEEWERKGYLEIFNTNSQKVFEQNVGIRLHGGWSRTHYRKSLRLYAKTEYGTDSEFNYSLFNDLHKKGFPDEPLDSFARIILRTSANDYEKTLYRDALMQELIKHLEIENQAYEPYILFINGEYWGIINARERIDEYYLASHYDLDPENIAILEQDASVDTGFESDRTHFLETLDFAETNDMSVEENYQWVNQRVDTANLALFYAIEIYYDNTDWPQNNIKLWRDRTGCTDPLTDCKGRWKWLFYDFDYGMNLYSDYNHMSNSLDRIIGDSRPNDPTSRLFLSLLENQEFKNSFINSFADNMNTSFVPVRVNSIIDEFNAKIASSRIEHYNRWQSGNDEGEDMKLFASERPKYIKQHIVDAFELSGMAELKITQNSDGGKINVNTIDINQNIVSGSPLQTPYTWQGSYFRDIPITLKAIADSSKVFSHWNAFADIIEPIAVNNHSFELPGTSKQTNWSNVPGWNSDTVATDSGVETAEHATDGNWAGYLKNNDPPVWNTTDYLIQESDRFRLRLDARRNHWNQNDLYARIYYLDGTSRITLGETTFMQLGSSMSEYELIVYTETYPQAIGKKIGIELQNTAASTTWLAVDNVRLDRIYELELQAQDWDTWLAGQSPEAELIEVALTNDMTFEPVFADAPTLNLLHYWSFNSSPVGSYFYTIGDASFEIIQGDPLDVVSDTEQDFAGENSRLDEPAGSHLRINDPLDKEIVFNLPTTGYEDIIVMYETRRSGKGAGEQTISYTVDGQNYTVFTTIEIFDAPPTLHTFDFNAIETVNNNPDFAIKITFNQADGGTGGNNRFDNLTVEGIAMEGTNLPPQLKEPIDLQYITEGREATIDLTDVFEDPDGDYLVFDAVSSKEFVATAEINGNLLTINGNYRGDSLISVYANDGTNIPLEINFRVLVYPAAHSFGGFDDYVFGQFDSELPENIFPDNMLFVQSSVDDPKLDAALDFPYWIAHDDYHADDADTIGYTYNNTGRTRINGLNELGISFINTGRGRDLGAAIVAIDTRNVEQLTASWLCGTVLENYRRYAIRLQYRIGWTGEFTDVLVDSQPVEYMVNTDGHTQEFSIELPQELLGYEYVQLAWRYYHVEVTSGARAELRLDDIVINAQMETPEGLENIAQWWLSVDCHLNDNCNGADMNEDGRVDIEDFAIFGFDWISRRY